MALDRIGKYLNRKNVLIMDFETTGLGRNDQMVEIAVIDTTGAVRLNTLIMPKNGRVPSEASAVHGITKETLMQENAPEYSAVHNKLMALLGGAKIVWAYNAEFERNTLKQTVKKYQKELDANPAMPEVTVNMGCAMLYYAEFRGEKHSYYGDWRWHKLGDAVKYETGRSLTQSHRALDDCFLVLKLMRSIDKKQSTSKVSRFVWALLAFFFFLWLVG